MVSGLKDKRILITREEKQARAFAEQVSQYGGVPVPVPLLKITCEHDTNNKMLLQGQETYKWLFFTSANGVSCFFALLHEEQAQSMIAGCRFAAVGRKTARMLESFGYKADFVPTTYNAETMTREFFLKHASLEEPVLLIQGSLSRSILPEWFAQQGISYYTMVVYRTEVHEKMKTQLNTVLEQEKLDAVTFTSPSSVNAFMELKNIGVNKSMPVCCIGTTTEKKAAAYGFRNLLVPDEFTVDGMLERLEKYFEANGKDR